MKISNQYIINSIQKNMKTKNATPNLSTLNGPIQAFLDTSEEIREALHPFINL